MRFLERKDFLYNPDLFVRADTQVALAMHSEYIERGSPRHPLPKFFEVDRRSNKLDHLWHVPLDDRTVFSRVIEMPALFQAERPDWRLTRVGIVPHQKFKVWMGNLILQKVDWFPVRGDLVYYNGYRHMIINVVMEPSAYWQQTNVWLGLVCETVIPAEGDARPVVDPGVAIPRELVQTRPWPED